MTSLPETLESIARQLAEARADGLSRDAIAALDPAEQLQVLRSVGRIQRLLDGVVVDVVDDIDTEDALRERADRVTARVGCRDNAELLQRVMLVDGPAARRYITAAAAAHEDVAVASGERLPGDVPELAAALRAGEISVAGFLACTGPLQRAKARIAPEEFALADAVLARAATGRDATGQDAAGEDAARVDAGVPGPSLTVAELAGLVAHVLLRIDPDGARPRDDAAERNRAFTIGRLHDGGVPVRGVLLPEVAATLQRLMDAYNNPRVQFSPSGEDALLDSEPEVPPLAAADARSPAQKRHDAFAAIVSSVAAAEAAPQLGGAAPTLLVSMNAADLASDTARAHLQSTPWDVPSSVARHAACVGGVQRVLFDDAGAIVGISTIGRIFTSYQRKAILLRDGGCVIPGCQVRGDWCELHHVQEWARGGPTHTSNGVALCWHHHRTLETSGWQIRMTAGLPQIRGPAWWDPYRRWRSPGSSPVVWCHSVAS